jgi:hypothetical protein
MTTKIRRSTGNVFRDLDFDPGTVIPNPLVIPSAARDLARPSRNVARSRDRGEGPSLRSDDGDATCPSLLLSRSASPPA